MIVIILTKLKKNLWQELFHTYLINMYTIFEMNGMSFKQNVYRQSETYIPGFQH